MTASKIKLAATLVAAGLVVGPGAAAQQRADDIRPTAKSAGTAREKADVAKAASTRVDPAAGPAEITVEERLRLAEKVLSDQLTLFRAGELSLADAEIPLWNSRVLGEHIAAGHDQAEAFRSFIETTREVESIVGDRFKRGEAAKTDVTRAQFNRIEAEDHTRQVWHLPPGPIRFPLKTGGAPERESIARAEPAVKTADASTRPAPPPAADPPAADRVKLSERVLAEQLALLQAGDARVGDMDRWNRRLLTARIDAGQDKAEALRSFLETSRKVESIARAQFKQGAIPIAEMNKAATDRSEAAAFALRSVDRPDQLAAARPAAAPVKPADTAANPEKPAPAATTPSGGAAERLRIAEDAIAAIKKLTDAPNNRMDPSFLGQLNMQLQNWQVVADEARHDLGGPDPGYLGAVRDLDKARDAEAEAKKRFEAGQCSKFDYLNAQLVRVQAQQQVDRWAQSEQQRDKKPAGATADPTDLKVTPGPNPGRGASAKSEIPEGGAGADPSQEPAPLRPRKLPKTDTADLERDTLIKDALEKTTSVKFPEGTTLDEVLATIRKATIDPAAGLKKGVPFYVDPLSLIEDPPGEQKRRRVFKTIAPIELEDIPLRVALRLALDQFGLSYQIRDRMVYIIDEELLDFRTEGAAEFHKATGSQPGMFMGGMGGGMGGMGSGMARPGGQARPGGMM